MQGRASSLISKDGSIYAGPITRRWHPFHMKATTSLHWQAMYRACPGACPLTLSSTVPRAPILISDRLIFLPERVSSILLAASVTTNIGEKNYVGTPSARVMEMPFRPIGSSGRHSGPCNAVCAIAIPASGPNRCHLDLKLTQPWSSTWRAGRKTSQWSHQGFEDESETIAESHRGAV